MNKKNGLKFWFFSVIAMLFLASSTIADDIDVNVNIKPAANYYLYELYQAVMENSNYWIVKNIVSIELVNNTDKTQHLKLRIKLYANKIDPSKPLVDYTTSYSDYPIEIGPKQAKIINTADQEMISGGILRSDKSEIRNKIKNAFGSNPLNISGWIPEDTYKYEILVFDKDDDERHVYNVLGSDSESMFIPNHSTNISVKQPATGIVNVGMATFSWEDVIVRSGIDIYYKLWLYEIEEFGIENYQNLIFKTDIKDGRTQIEYTGSRDLELGKKYALIIYAYDELGLQIAKSNPREFQYGLLIPPTISDGNDLKTHESFPVSLKWSAVDINNDFKVVISEDADHNNSVIKEEVSNISQYTIHTKENITPGKIYYWYVAWITDNGDEIKSKTGSFKIKQVLNLTSPDNNEVIKDKSRITFFWQGSPFSQYVLKISYSETIENYKRYIVNGTKETLSLEELCLKPDMIHYWTVREIDAFGNQWGIQPKPETFKLPKLASPDIIYPKNERIINTLELSFAGVDWADSYRIDIFSRDKERVFSQDLNGGYVKINLDELPRFVAGKSYRWTVTAMSADCSYSVRSEYGKFIYVYKEKTSKGSNATTAAIELTKQAQYLVPSARIEWKYSTNEDLIYEIHFSDNIFFLDSEIIEVSDTKYIFESVDKYKADLYYRIVAYDLEERFVARSKVGKISISDIDILYEPIVLIGPKEKIEKNRHWGFNWLPEINDATLIIGTNKNLKNAKRFVVSGGKIDSEDVNYKFKIGVDYFWTLIKENHVSNSIYKFKIVPRKIKLVQPLNKVVGSKKVLFQWVSDPESSYRLILAKDELFKDIVDKIDTDKLMVKYELKNYGKLYWRVQQLSGDNRVIQNSESSNINFMKPKQALTNTTRKNLEYFIKQRLDDENKIKVEEWKLIKVESLGESPAVDEDDIKYLLNEGSSYQGIIE
ncbi:hypothetical protein DID74_00510 [Candidatus Marinamargulisbacteria bacterium SCGC AG-333-B06]|nr:hypothetical protein DID74_00510 [Candidatus Marinamargulisbacteria bacterium SCGC AG-333-B06]